ncbi:glutamic acid-rich protein precursor, putative [Perkinsus marinus ATCC 50983]|uniref:Glutamic acid-rich protein, putative n=1 Tax=Perkinsus marinus (strain ATCC 50983 / TXsc) TaxID=423536 RepID=C5L4E2_PERM5|nr:glutamic acid-rich protein precursor, putative [Perkinsus marinus ATCC 50983]EER08379.1 glutamic acid-rich protein precursor, putative [Perkinsus marinus ATCC 50983]|eukprot:XP_002776563.1 glutamic acid-rich protein precursor, putative [Perkinsus marinus ATCC 50983]
MRSSQGLAPIQQGKPPIVLEEEVDENYEPTQEEILEYAEWIGMDVAVDKDLFWIAKEGLKAPLPAPWKPCQTGEGDIFYFNFETGQSVWDHPCDEYYKNLFSEHKQRKVTSDERKIDGNEQATTGKEKKHRESSVGGEGTIGLSSPSLPLGGGGKPRVVPPLLPGLEDLKRPSLDIPTARDAIGRSPPFTHDLDHAREASSMHAENGRELAALEEKHAAAVVAMKADQERIVNNTRAEFNRLVSQLRETHEKEKKKLLMDFESEMRSEKKRLEEQLGRERARLEQELRRAVEEEVEGQRESLMKAAQERMEREVLENERSCREAELSVINGDHAKEIERLVEEHCTAVRELRQQQEEEIQRVRKEHQRVLSTVQADEERQRTSTAGEEVDRRDIESRIERELRPEMERRLRLEMACKVEAEVRPVIERDVRQEVEEANACRREEIESELRHEIELELKQSGDVIEAVRQDLRCELRGPIEEELRAALEAQLREDIRRDLESEMKSLRTEFEKEVQATVGEGALSLRGSSVLLDLPDLSAISNYEGQRESRVSGDFEGILRILGERQRQLETRENDAAEALSEKEERIAAALRRLHETREQLTVTEADATEKGHEIARLRRELSSREKMTTALRDQVTLLEAEVETEKRNAQASGSEAMREVRRRQRLLDERETELEVKEIRQGEVMAHLRAREAALITEKKRLQDDANKLEAEAAEIATMQQTLKSITHEVKHAQEIYSPPGVREPPMTSRPATDEVIMTELGEIKSAIVQLSARGARPFGTRNSSSHMRSDKATDSDTAPESCKEKEDGFIHWLCAEREAIEAAKKRVAAEHAMCRAERSRLEMERQIWRDRMREAKRNGDHRAKGELMRAKSALDARAAEYNVSVAESQVESGKLEERERALEKYSASRMYREKRLNQNRHYWGRIPPPLPFGSE